MSYEGYLQQLCARGHLREFDCWDFPDPADKCSCGERFVFFHCVDNTNGDDPEDPSTLRYPFEVHTEAVTSMCNLGHEHIITEVTYKIPEKLVHHDS